MVILNIAGCLTFALSKAVHTVAAFLAGDDVAEKDRVREWDSVEVGGRAKVTSYFALASDGANQEPCTLEGAFW